MPLRPYRRRRPQRVPKRHRYKRHRVKRHRAAKRSRWRWLGLGALAIAAAALLRREQRPSQRAEVPAEGIVPSRDASGVSESPPGILQSLDDIHRCWIAGPTGTLHVLERHPEGELPVVFIHAIGGCAEHWAAQIEAAGPAIRAVAFDLPGHGRSDRAEDGDYSIPKMAAAIGAVIDGLGLRRAVLVAHSLGATAAIEYADTHRNRVAGLLMIDPSGDQTRLPEAHRRQLLTQLSQDPEEELRWYFRQLLAGAQTAVADRVLEDLRAVPTEIVVNAIDSGVSHSPLPALKRFDGPIRSLISDLNNLPYSLHNLSPDLPVLHLPQASHWLMMDRPEMLWESIVDFLDEVDTQARHAPPGRHFYTTRADRSKKL